MSIYEFWNHDLARMEMQSMEKVLRFMPWTPLGNFAVIDLKVRVWINGPFANVLGCANKGSNLKDKSIQSNQIRLGVFWSFHILGKKKKWIRG